MANEVKIPQLGESITSGIIAQWLVEDGSSVTMDQPILSLETDKITAEINATAAGIIHLHGEEGDEVEVGSVIATIDEASASGADANSGSPANGTPNDSEGETTPPAPTAPQSGPAARKLASEKDVDISKIEGSGKDGRATKADVLAAAAKGSAPKTEQPKEEPATAVTTAPAATPPVKAAPPAQAPAQASTSERQTRRKMTPLRRRVAERLVRAKQEAAMLTTFNEVDMSAVMNLRKAHQETFQKKHGIKLGFMSFFVKAVVNALKEVPEINTQIDGDYIIENHFYDIGIAVGAPRGLVVPVVRDADMKGFADIEREISDYGKRARDNKLTIDDLQGGVFTITNGGIYGSLMSTPILNPPQSGILGMHGIKERAVVVDGQVVARPMMYLALSYDHRVVDGKEAVTFLVKVKEAIEDPIRLLFEM